MPANTPGGWPYVLPADHPLEYPAQSQQLATQLDTAFAGQKGVITPFGSWSDVGGPYGGLYVTRVGGLVVIDALFKSPAVTVSAGTVAQLGTVPVGFRPAVHQVMSAQLLSVNGNAPWALCTMDVNPSSGALTITPSATATFTTSGFVVANLAYRGA